MINICPAIHASAGFISSMTTYIDCKAQVLGLGAWNALAVPGSTLSVVLTGFLTIFVVLIGYNLLLGHSITMRSGTLAAVKVGAILALTTSWPAYRTLVYDLVTDGPSQLVAEMGPATSVLGSEGTLTQRLDLVDQALAHLGILGPGNPPPALSAQIPPAPFVGFDSFALGASRILFELSAVAGLGIVRIIIGLMLAFGPFFIAFLMFDSTRSLFEGWIRVLGGAALASTGVSIVLGLELALIEPWLTEVLARRMAGEALPMVSTELFVIVCLCSILLAAAPYACTRVMRAFRLAPLLHIMPAVADLKTNAETTNLATVHELSREVSSTERTRAAAVASVLLANSRRERMDMAVQVLGDGARGKAPIASPSNDAPQPRAPIGRSFTRRPHARTSAVAAKRDQGT